MMNLNRRMIDLTNSLHESVDSELHISSYKDNRNGFYVLEASVDGTPVSILYYSLSPIIAYTKDKNPEDYVYIEWVKTNDKYRKKGYANALVKYLVDKYPDKTVISNPNELSADIMMRNGVVNTITEASNWYPPRTKSPLDVDKKSYHEQMAYGINSAFKAMSNTTKKQFLDRYVPRDISKQVYKQMLSDGTFPEGSKMPVYMLVDLPDDTVYSMAYNARELRNAEKDEQARTKPKRRKVDPNDPSTWSKKDQAAYDAYLKQMRKADDDVRRELAEERQRQIDEGILDEDGNPRFY